MTLESIARTHWEGDLSGRGTTSIDSGAVDPFSVTWNARTEEHGGLTSPEELIAAAHASCFSMALSADLARGGNPPESLETEAKAIFEKTDAGWRLTTINLSVRGRVPGIDAEGFRNAAEGAKENCPVSQALKGNVRLNVEASLD